MSYVRPFRGQHFQTAPLGAVEKVAGASGDLRIVRDASHRGDAPRSVNDQINPDEQTTRWGTDMAEIVSTHLSRYALKYRADLHHQ
jgi:hypothetical protein